MTTALKLIKQLEADFADAESMKNISTQLPALDDALTKADPNKARLWTGRVLKIKLVAALARGDKKALKALAAAHDEKKLVTALADACFEIITEAEAAEAGRALIDAAKKAKLEGWEEFVEELEELEA